MDVDAHVRALNQRRVRLWESAQAHLDDCQRRHPGRPLSAEERRTFESYTEEIDQIDAERNRFIDREERERDSAIARDAFERQYGTAGASQRIAGEERGFRAWLRGEARGPEGNGNTWSVNIRAAQRERALIRQGAGGEELRTLLWDTGTSGSLVPTTLSRSLYQYMEASIAALRMPTTKVTTASGEPMNFPRVLAHGIGTQVIAQGTAIGGTDPTFSYMHLDAYKFGQLVQVASEVIQDSGIDVTDFIGKNIGRAIGRLVDQKLILGTGSGEPQGMLTAAITGSGGTVATGGTLISPSYEVLVNTAYSVNDAYRNESNGSTAWLMHDSTAGTLRKLRSDAGGTVGPAMWVPSITQGLVGGTPDTLLGFPVYTDANVATQGSNARIVAFGDWQAYYCRLVGDVVIERSDDFAFNTDLVTYRGKLRCDGDYEDLTAVNLLKQSVT